MEVLNGSGNVTISAKAGYCVDPHDLSSAGNGENMKSHVIDLAYDKNGKVTINGEVVEDGLNGKREILRIMYFATNAYNGTYVEGYDEGVRARRRWKYMMEGEIANNATTIRNYIGGVSPWYFDTLNVAGPTAYEYCNTQANAYVDSTIRYSFEDKSTENIQTIYENGDWVFVGPYKISNTGSGTIESINAISIDGTEYSADGWATSTDISSITQNYNLPNGTDFYVVFRSHKPESIDKIQVKKNFGVRYRTRMVFCESDGGQNIAIYGGKEVSSETEMAILELPGVPYSEIKVNKVDEESGIPLANVGFIVYDQTTGKSVKDGSPARYVHEK